MHIHLTFDVHTLYFGCMYILSYQMRFSWVEKYTASWIFNLCPPQSCNLWLTINVMKRNDEIKKSIRKYYKIATNFLLMLQFFANFFISFFFLLTTSCGSERKKLQKMSQHDKADLFLFFFPAICLQDR